MPHSFQSINIAKKHRTATSTLQRVTRRPLILSLCATLLAICVSSSHSSAEDVDPIPANVQSALDRGLEWLAHQQNADGYFPSNVGRSTAITSLAVMTFLAEGQVPGQGPYGEQINKSIDWVLAQQKPSGLLAAEADQYSMYNHGISCVMLCETYGMTDPARQIKIRNAIADAVQLILDAQRVSKGEPDQGGWRYTPDMTDSDISVTGWQLMALRGAANIGAAVPKQALQDGLTYLTAMANPTGGFGYREPFSVTPPRTGTGVLAMELLGQHHSAPAIAGGDYLLSHPFNDPHLQFYFYGVYYASQAANQLGGKHWTGIYPPLRETLIANQNLDGSWTSSNAEAIGDVYSTSMALLALAVPHRYLPLYQR